MPILQGHTPPVHLDPDEDKPDIDEPDPSDDEPSDDYWDRLADESESMDRLERGICL